MAFGDGFAQIGARADLAQYRVGTVVFLPVDDDRAIGHGTGLGDQVAGLGPAARKADQRRGITPLGGLRARIALGAERAVIGGMRRDDFHPVAGQGIEPFPRTRMKDRDGPRIRQDQPGQERKLQPQGARGRVSV